MPNILRETVNGLRAVAIEDELLMKREIFLTTEVNSASMNRLMLQIMFLEREDSKKEIKLYINSPGGEVISGLAMYDCLSMIKAPLTTICIGTASSMGAILFLAGKKRLMLPHSWLMIHDPSYGTNDIGGKKPHEIQQELDQLNETKDILAGIIADKIGKSMEEVCAVTEKDSFFSAEQAIDFGLATGMLMKL